MADLLIPYDTDKVVYVTIQRLSDGLYRKTDGTYEAYDAAHWASYAHALAESPAGSGKYRLAFPESSGVYWVQAVERLGGAAATGDLPSFADYPSYDPNPDTGGGTTTTGANLYPVTVQDDVGAIEGATVRFSNAGSTVWIGTTGSDGVAHASVDDGTYTISVTKLPYNGQVITGVGITADGSRTVTLARTSVSVSDPDKVTLYATLYADDGSPAAGEVATLRLKDGPGTPGVSLVRGQESAATSNGAGYVEWTQRFPGATYEVRRGDGAWVAFAVPADATGSVAIDEFLGVPQPS